MPCPDSAAAPPPGRGGNSVVHLSVAIGRFFEALLWAVARGVGVLAGWGLLALIGLAIVVLVLRTLWRRR